MRFSVILILVCLVAILSQAESNEPSWEDWQAQKVLEAELNIYSGNHNSAYVLDKVKSLEARIEKLEKEKMRKWMKRLDSLK